MADDFQFSKSDMDTALQTLAKEFKRLNGKHMPAEIILVGGASILANYSFRTQTYDMDALIAASSAMKEAISRTADKLDLPYDWLNTDFTKTSSYSPALVQHSVYYRTFSNILTVRTVRAEYLVAMKLMAGREYKKDLSDVVGILLDHQNAGCPISLDAVKRACAELYGSLDKIPPKSLSFIRDVMGYTDLQGLYGQTVSMENDARTAPIRFEKKYPNVVTQKNLNDMLEIARRKLKETQSSE